MDQADQSLQDQRKDVLQRIRALKGGLERLKESIGEFGPVDEDLTKSLGATAEIEEVMDVWLKKTNNNRLKFLSYL